MRSLVTAVIAAIEAVAVAFAGLAVVAVPGVLLWVVTFGLSAEPASVTSAVTGVWLLAHFVPLHFAVPAEAALAMGLAPEALQFTLSIAPLGITLVTVLLALRSGWRFAARGGVGAFGALGGAAGLGGIAFAAAALAAPLLVWPHALAAAVAAAVFGLSSLAAFVVRAAIDGHDWWHALVRQVQRGLEALGFRGAASLPARGAEALRLAAASIALVIGLAAVAFSIAVITSYADVTALTQSLQLDPLGSLTVFISQLALVPTAIVWSLSWLAGPGFAVGVGSSTTPFETLLGPLPALPIFGAIPSSWGTFGGVAPAIIVLAAIVLGVRFARRPAQRRSGWSVVLAAPVIAGLCTGLVAVGLAAAAGGAMGPDRLAENGPSPWAFGGFLALEVGAGLLLGALAGRVDVQQVRSAMPERVVDATPALAGLTLGRRRRAEPVEADVVSARLTAPDAFEAPDAYETVELERSAIDEAHRDGAYLDDASVDTGNDETTAFETGRIGTAEFETAQFESAEFETAQIDADDLEAASSASMPFDTQPEPDQTAREANADDSGADSELSEADLLRAYAWDAAPEPTEASPDAEDRGEKRSGWRWPGGGH